MMLQLKLQYFGYLMQKVDSLENSWTHSHHTHTPMDTHSHRHMDTHRDTHTLPQTHTPTGTWTHTDTYSHGHTLTQIHGHTHMDTHSNIQTCAVAAYLMAQEVRGAVNLAQSSWVALRMCRRFWPGESHGLYRLGHD